jgi:transposase InsO family protein
VSSRRSIIPEASPIRWAFGTREVLPPHSLGIEQLLTPVRAPRANAVAERMVGTFRRECLDHVIIVNERHLHALLAEFTAYYNRQRPHRTLRRESPVPTARAPTGLIRSRPVLGGLHHRYDRAA